MTQHHGPVGECIQCPREGRIKSSRGARQGAFSARRAALHSSGRKVATGGEAATGRAHGGKGAARGARREGGIELTTGGS